MSASTIQELKEEYMAKWVDKTLTQAEINSIVLNEIVTVYNVLIALDAAITLISNNFQTFVNTTNTNFETVNNAFQSMNTTIQQNTAMLSQQINDSAKSQNTIVQALSQSIDKQIQKLQKAINSMVRK